MDWISSQRKRFSASCRRNSDYVLVEAGRITIHTAVERPLDEQSGRRLATWATAAGLSGIFRSNFIQLQLNDTVTPQQVVEQLEACRKAPLLEGIAEVLDRTGLWDDLPAQAELFIQLDGELCNVYRHLREPIRNIPNTQFRWSE